MYSAAQQYQIKNTTEMTEINIIQTSNKYKLYNEVRERGSDGVWGWVRVGWKNARRVDL